MGVEITNTKERIIELLEKHKVLREDDNRLICNIWLQDLQKMGLDLEIPTREFFTLLCKHQLTTPESIRRSRAKLQEKERIDLRGDNYEERKKKKAGIQQQLGYTHKSKYSK